MDSKVSELAQTPAATDEVAQQPLITLLRRIPVPLETVVEDGDRFLESGEAAALLRISQRTLQRLRQNGQGPSVTRIGRRRLIYRIADLQQWAREQSSQATGNGIRSAPLSVHVEIADPPKPAIGAPEDPVPETCGRCQAFSDGHCVARDFAVGSDEPRCPLFAAVGYLCDRRNP